ncbi:MAG: T9SS type A sorting domain-containing protein [Ignavibacteria bacterium]|nr:T9SS type A sorting domain-containing protein [Ignavibacteria bacterium]
MRKNIFVNSCLIVMSSIVVQAQSSLLPAGGDASGSGGSSSYSIGQIDYLPLDGSNGAFYSGVQQPFEFFTVGIEEDNGICLSLSVFPNPAQSVIHLHIDHQTTEQLAYQVFDMAGKELFGQKIAGEITPISMETLTVGAYIIKVSTATTILKTFTIIKNN